MFNFAGTGISSVNFFRRVQKRRACFADYKSAYILVRDETSGLTGGYNLLHSVDPFNPTAAEQAASELAGNEAALLYFTDAYPTGITILKADVNGVFQPLHLISTTSSTGITIYLASPCN